MSLHSAEGTGKTPLHYAAENNSQKVVQALLSAGADINAKDKKGNTTLHHDAQCDSCEVYARIISEGREAPERIGKNRFCSFGILEYLVSQGADVNAKNNAGKTALDYVREQEKRETDPKRTAKLREAIELLERTMGETIA